MHRTLIIRREYLHYVPKYSRYEKRHANLAAHVSPAFRVQDGDQVVVGQCRPLAKTVSVADLSTCQIGILTCFPGAIQRPQSLAPHGQGRQGLLQVLDSRVQA